MRSVRRRQLSRLVVLALLVWLGTDALAPGTCTHDLFRFARTRSQVGDTATPHQGTPDGDVNHCSCHWQYLPAAPIVAAELRALAPIVPPPAAAVPPVIQRTLERPPQSL